MSSEREIVNILFESINQPSISPVEVNKYCGTWYKKSGYLPLDKAYEEERIKRAIFLRSKERFNQTYIDIEGKLRKALGLPSKLTSNNTIPDKLFNALQLDPNYVREKEKHIRTVKDWVSSVNNLRDCIGVSRRKGISIPKEYDDVVNRFNKLKAGK